ncbi:MAG: M20/M25/M40 family metallo-hydrolase [Acidobacteriota bacterium]|nr:M20/M25/M40 family metallo-hydrolase [Acidobacteriota bacterium]
MIGRVWVRRAAWSGRGWVPGAALGLALCGAAGAQQAVAPAPPDPALARALTEVSAARIGADIAKLVSFHNRVTVGSMDTDLPAGTGVLAAADWIEGAFRQISSECGGCLEVKRDDFVEPAQTGPTARIKRSTRIVNVYAVLHGGDPAQANRRVLVTGHYDSRATDVMDTRTEAPGANDDASGVAVSLECARVLTKSGIRFPSSLVFAAVAGEEQGLNGSRHLAKLARAEGWDLEAVLNNDIVGGDTTPGETKQDKRAVRVFSEGVPGTATLEDLHRIQTVGAEGDSPSRELARAVVDVAATYFTAAMEHAPAAAAGHARSHAVRVVPPFHPVLEFRRDRYLRGGDHTSFNLEGWPAVRFTEWRENYAHQHNTVRIAEGRLPDATGSGAAATVGQVQYGDLIQYVDMEYVANVARLNAATLGTLALAPGVPRSLKIAINVLDNDTKLEWQAPEGFPAGASYEVVWRDTDAPTWTQFMNAGTATTVTLPISKDNVVFGVRSVDGAGHRSAAGYPWPTSAAAFPAPPPAGSK